MNLLGIAGWSGCGKTTLIERLIPELTALGWRVGVVKHAHHNFDADIPGKDSHRFRMAGACAVLATSSRRWALIRELAKSEAEADVWRQAERLAREGECDLILAEGFKSAAIPKLEVWRAALGRPLLDGRENVLGVVSDDVPPLPAGDEGGKLRRFSPDAAGEIAAFVSSRFRPGGAAG